MSAAVEVIHTAHEITPTSAAISTYEQLDARSAAATRYLLAVSGRTGGGVLIRRGFVWQGEGKQARPGPLAEIVRKRDERMLDAYLLLLTVARRDWSSFAIPSRLWLDALRLEHSKSGTVALSKLFRRLSDRGLVRRVGLDGLRGLSLLREDGSRVLYSDPGRDETRNYFKLRFEYWTDGWSAALSMAEKAVLFIGLSRGPTFGLPITRSNELFGVSSDTMNRGISGLMNRGLLASTEAESMGNNTPYPFARRFQILGSFSRSHRDVASPVKAIYQGEFDS